MQNVAKQVNAWDVLVLAATHISSPSSIVQSSLQDWWADYETHVKAIVIASRAFVPNVKSDAAALPPANIPGLSGYLTSKVPQTKIIEFLSAENPELFACAVHPGMVDTGIFRGSGPDPSRLPMDSDKCVSERARTNADYSPAELSANFLVWLAQAKLSVQRYLRGI